MTAPLPGMAPIGGPHRSRGAARPTIWVALAAGSVLFAAGTGTAFLYAAFGLSRPAAPRHETALARCLSGNTVPDISGLGQVLIQHACELQARNGPSPATICVLGHRAALLDSSAPRKLAQDCGFADPEVDP